MLTPSQGRGIARILSSQGNLAVALLARNPDNLSSVATSLRTDVPHGTFETFPTDTSPASLSRTFGAIREAPAFQGLKLKLAIYSIKHASKKPFLEETHEAFMASMEAYVGGAVAFSQEVIKLLLDHHPQEEREGGGEHEEATALAKKGTLIFTGTLGALRTNAQFSAYGATRSSVRMLAQGLAKEFSEQGIHVAHAVANGAITDDDGGRGGDQGAEGGGKEEAVKRGKAMSAESVGRTYLWLSEQTVDLWTHELDMRPAMEKF